MSHLSCADSILFASRRRAAATAHVALVAVVLVLALVQAGCNRPSEANWNTVAAGMTAEEVEAILGAPSSRHIVPVNEQAQRDYVSWWQYGDRLSTLATEALFPGMPDSRTFAVLFNAEGRVVGTQAPLDGW